MDRSNQLSAKTIALVALHLVWYSLGTMAQDTSRLDSISLEWRKGAEARWAIQPWSQEHIDLFHWKDEDAKGQLIWLELRENWDTNSTPEYQSMIECEDETAWSWWKSKGVLSFYMISSSLFILVGGIAFGLRQQAKTRLAWEGLLEHWPELHTIVQILQGEQATPTFLAAVSQARQRFQPASPMVHPDWSVLNSSEKECLDLILKRLTPTEIAEIMHCTPKHIYNLRSSLRRKLNVEAEDNLDATIIQRFSMKG